MTIEMLLFLLYVLNILQSAIQNVLLYILWL